MKAACAYWVAALLGIQVFLGAGCTAPISARQTSSKAAFRQLNANVLATGTLTPDTRTILRRYDQETVFDQFGGKTNVSLDCSFTGTPFRMKG
jgi:hypothetical protein